MHAVPCPVCVAVLQRSDTHCGGHWAAATNQARRREKQEVTGRYFLTDARHGGPVAALNQIRTGERYSYALTLGLAAAAEQTGLQQLHIDIMCKWAGWLQRLSSTVTSLPPDGQLAADAAVQSLSARLAQLRGLGKDICKIRLVHSAAHGSLHAQSCQVGLCHSSLCAPTTSCKSLGAQWRTRLLQHCRLSPVSSLDKCSSC